MKLQDEFASLNPAGLFSLPKLREGTIAASKAKGIKSTFKTNEKAKLLHPGTQEMRICRIDEHTGADTKTFYLKKTDGTAAAWFRAGQYLSIRLDIDGSSITRPYSISSSPLLSRDGIYTVTIQNKPDGFASSWILDNWKAGDTVKVSEPLGSFYYEPLRDEKNVLAIAGGSGITPFISMARAVRDGLEDMDLTILYGSRTESRILFKEELDEICKICPKVKVVHVLSDEIVEGYEHGFIDAELISKYADGNTSIFVCGPDALYSFAEKELEKNGTDKKHARFELSGTTKSLRGLPGYPVKCLGKVFTLTVKLYAKTLKIPARAGEPLLVALERAGIPAPSHCRSGECGWCRSKLLCGSVFIPEKIDGRRKADRSFGYIHPCCAFPVSDVALEVSLDG